MSDLRPCTPCNRKYLGSKRLLRGWIADRMVAAAGVPATFIDGFVGTGSLTLEMLGRGAGSVTAIDNLRSNCVILRAACTPPGEPDDHRRRLAWLAELDELPGRDGYATESWAARYFTTDNCRRIDAIRDRIEELASAGAIDEPDRDWLVACLLLATDRVANTLGQYDAFLKHIDEEPVTGGRHVRDGRVTDRLRLRPLEAVPGRVEVREADILSFEALPSAEVTYLDPPYNGRQYCDNYHVLENIARWDKPPLAGKTRKFDRRSLRSPFSRRSTAVEALEMLLARVRSPHLFLSYSSEGILGRTAIEAMLSRRWEVAVHEVAYPVFGNGAGVSRRRQVSELLFHARLPLG